MKYSLEKYIVQNVNAPYVNVDVDSDNITIKLSLDKQADWNYGYWMNSRRAMFQIFWENDKIKIALMDCHSKLPKFRKCTVKTVDKALIKIDNWINNASRVEVVV